MKLRHRHRIVKLGRRSTQDTPVSLHRFLG